MKRNKLSRVFINAETMWKLSLGMDFDEAYAADLDDIFMGFPL